MKDGWINVRDTLPEESGYYQVAMVVPVDDYLYLDDGEEPWNLNYVTMAWFNMAQGGIWQIDNNVYGTDLDKIDTSRYDYISHWAPMLDLPDELKPKGRNEQ